MSTLTHAHGPPARIGRTWFAAVASLLACFAALPVAAADPASQIQAHLAAGEFGPALAMAQRAPVADRDRLLALVAGAQAQGGNLHAAQSTLGSLSSSSARQQAANQIQSQPLARGGGPVADFDAVIDLITSTIAPPTWDTVGGPGAIDGFEGGVKVDPTGLLRKVALDSGNTTGLRAKSKWGVSDDVRRGSTLRKISLVRLERELQRRFALGQKPDDAMQALAGIERIQYLFVYPESGDIVIAGPAGDWRPDSEGRLVSVSTGRPVLRLDDLVVLLRNAWSPEGKFGCSITPKQEGLAAVKAYLAESSKSPLKPGQRDRWADTIREKLGRQTIEVYGIDPRSRVGRVIVEADYRMKLVGMGLEEGVLGVQSYLSLVKVGPDGKLPPMDVLRWWFTLNYDSLAATADRQAFSWKGQGVQVQSENEAITDKGERIHTGVAEEWNREFAHSFTAKFNDLAVKYPVYADLQNIFDLAIAAAVMKHEDLPGKVGWQMSFLGPKGAYGQTVSVAHHEVESVVNHRLIGGKHIVLGVSGGVTVMPRTVVKADAFKAPKDSKLEYSQTQSTPQNKARSDWWWD